MAKIIKYKGNPILFNGFQNLKWRVGALGAIIQNPEMEVTHEEFVEWVARAEEVKQDLHSLINQSIKLVEDGEIGPSE